ncbi:hypothetical protein [Afifella sp. IM 167]|uniref:hypothetical protein n=1 Tax=Afifella sp. IM 167 TaxID=2033586 RepID=UPI001CC9F58C|nr:hypothetical protein [Afifella sp. IM 167]MBZ8134234.1 hypothetical protein [Afifella sp. IM 167]
MASRSDRLGAGYIPAATGFFCLPFAASALGDLLVLKRGPDDHLGDYSGLFSLGLGWLNDIPFTYFAWPAWTFGQLSAAIAWFMPSPVTDLAPFYNSWAVFNLASFIWAGLLLAFLLADRKAPSWAALAFGLIAAAIPMVQTGWNHSNPYVSLIALLVPGMFALALRLAVPAGGALRWFEGMSLMGVGFALANNFGVATLIIAGALAFVLARPSAFLPLARRPWAGFAVRRPSSLWDGAFPLAGGILLTSVIIGIAITLAPGRPYFFDFADAHDVLATIAFCGSAIVAVLVFWFLYQRLSPEITEPWGAILLGWLISGNVLVFAFGRAALVASSDYSRPGLPSLFPQIAWTSLADGTHGFLFIALGYFGGLAGFVLSLAMPRRSWASGLRGPGLLAVLIVLTMHAVSGWPFGFPVPYEPTHFGIDGRYIWLGVTAPVVMAAAALALAPGRRTALALTAVALPLGIASLVQGFSAKNIIVERIETALAGTNAAIDAHLAASPQNIVLVANAYYPERAQVLYAYHNSLRGVPPSAPESLQSGRIRYIGRLGGYLWKPPLDIMREEGLDAQNILLIAEQGAYPAYVQTVTSYGPPIGVLIGRISSDTAVGTGTPQSAASLQRSQ